MSRRAIVGGVLVVAVAMSGAILAFRGDSPAPVKAQLTIAEALSSGDLSGFARADRPRPFDFPRDHGPHPAFRTEWWYWTGNLRGADGRHFGFQLTFFRTALTPEAVARGSAWGANQVYLAHFAITDVAGARFHAWSRTSRAALGLAGAESQPFRVWLDDWEAHGEGDAGLPMRLRAAEGDMALDLTLESAKPVALQGDRGWSRKGPEAGNASYYYSLTRMPARGAVTVAGQRVAVTGLAWMDREWSTSALGPELDGWDWLALQWDDGRDLMFYRLRRKDGGVDRFSAGAMVDTRGVAQALGFEEVMLEPEGAWTSPRTGARYPARWRLRIPALGLEALVVPVLADQELDVGARYWEGAVIVNGSQRSGAVSGRGYLEMVGYGP
jgi:predicted secreted hydrolase